ncbi:MAG: insulinase family protein [Magnetococcales bacterium]|nr:insulinase family protein [Magnetococcales bacterium]
MTHPDFELLRREPVTALKLTVESYRHRITGARHVHLMADDPHNAFLVAFLTVPLDSSGVAHILEHTALCGSQRYPVRDPFFMMLRRSLSTFMNAFTSSDWTAYPFATQSRKDFDNLLRVYLDAAFFPNLHALDFAQEGCRVEFVDPNDPKTDLVFKGVVYNEMKGAMSSPARVLSHTLSEQLFPTTTYHFNSGGDPEEIPSLTLEGLKGFHARHYHPSNAIFMTYGDISAHEHQTRFQDLVLSHFQENTGASSIPDEVRHTAPLRVEGTYALDGADEIQGKTHVVLGWLLGRSMELETLLNAHVLNGVLLDNSSSPLLKLLETSELGASPSSLSGLDDSGRELVFACGLEGSEPEHADAVEREILDLLERVSREGVEPERLESVLHQLELSRREIGGDGMPYGLKLLLNALTPVLHGGDPVTALALDEALVALRERVKDPDFIKGLARQWLVDNPHRVRVVLTPDPILNARRAEQEAERLRVIRAAMDDATRQQVMEQARALMARQELEDDPEILPRLELGDIPDDIAIPEGTEAPLGQLPVFWFKAATNRLVYQQYVLDPPAMPDELLELLPIFSTCLPEVGCGGRDYLETQAHQSAISGGIAARIGMRSSVDDLERFRGVFCISGKALSRNQDALSQLLKDTIDTARFDEWTRLRELVAQMRSSAEMRVTENGHVLALSAAGAGLNAVAALNDRWGGMLAVKRLKALDKALDDPGELAAFAGRLEALREVLRQAPGRMLIVGEEEDFANFAEGLSRTWGGRERVSDLGGGIHAGPLAGPERHAWATVTTVNFCARVHKTVPYAHPDAPVLAVLGLYLKNGYLHRAIRERGGAYGGGAGYDSDSGLFRFYSYRDPRLEETLADFERSIEWLTSGKADARALEEAILGVAGLIDRPGSPAGESKRAFHDALYGRLPEVRRAFRKRVLEVTGADLRRMAETYLSPVGAGYGVVTQAEMMEKGLGGDWIKRTL